MSLAMSGDPTVSVIMANYNGAAHIADAVRSVLDQSQRSLELILADDGSSDDSLDRALVAAHDDARLVVVRGGGRTGPAATRNRALSLARGRWVAIVDNDDLIEPNRLARLIQAAESDAADVAADNLMTFYEDGARAPHPHLVDLAAPRWVDAAEYAQSNILMRGGSQLGYLKPVFKRDMLGARPYDETLRIGEDADLVLRLLIAGARMRVYPECGYRYRKHAASISHRLTLDTLDAMLAAHDRLEPGGDTRLVRTLAQQRNALLDARAFSKLVDALKARDAGAALQTALRRPSALALLRQPLAARWRRFSSARAGGGKSSRHRD